MSFSELSLNTPLLNAITDMGLSKPTIIQSKAFPVVMSGADMIGIAQTGTGKTLAYLLPCLKQWKFTNDRYPQILVLVPTRELAVQVLEEAQKLTAYMNVRSLAVYGGTNIKTQAEQVYAGVDLLVATPGRLYDLAMQGTLRLKSVKKLVIDEVDEMLDLGFRGQLTAIMELLPTKRQNLMFSATLSPEVETLINDFFYQPKKIEVAPSGTPLENILQVLYKVPNFNTKVNLLHYLLAQNSLMSKVVVFVATKKLADMVFEELNERIPGCAVIHSNKSQNNRFNTVNSFEQGQVRTLIATDIIARGIDINDVTHVVNFDIPEQPESYINRIGRTGRAEKKGESIAFMAPWEEELFLAAEILMNQPVTVIDLPEDVEISDQLIADEMPVLNMKNVLNKTPNREGAGSAFHEKLEKNKKVNNKIPHATKMRMKYGKPKTRGQKKK